MSVTFRDRYSMGVSGTPGTGTITIGSAQSGYQAFTSTDNALTFDVFITDGTAWEIDTGCTYTSSGTTLTRGTLVASSTGSILSLSSAAIVSVGLTAERAATFLPAVITSPSTGQVLQYNGTNWVNATSSGGSSIPDYVSYTFAGGV